MEKRGSKMHWSRSWPIFEKIRGEVILGCGPNKGMLTNEAVAADEMFTEDSLKMSLHLNEGYRPLLQFRICERVK